METPKTPCCSTPNCCSSSSPIFKLACLFVGLLIALALFLNAYLLLNKKGTVPQAPGSSLITPTLDLYTEQGRSATSNWSTFEIKTVGLEFRLPPEISGKNWQEKLINGEKGKMLCFQVEGKSSGLIKSVIAGGAACGSLVYPALVLGGSSVDFEAGREGGFTDYQGFVKRNNQYFARFVGGKEVEIPINLIKEVRHNQLQIIKVSGKNLEPSTEREVPNWPIPGTPGDGYIGALINTNSSTYRGISVQLKLNEGVSETTFDQILSTFRFTVANTQVNQSDPLDVANIYLNAYVNRDWTTAKLLSGDNDFDENLAMSYGFTKYEITGSKPDSKPNYYHVYVKFTDQSGNIFDKAPYSSQPLEVLMFKGGAGKWSALTWYFFE